MWHVSTWSAINCHIWQVLTLVFRMRREVQVQLALALVGIPAIFYFWRGDGAKWPNPLKPSPPTSRSEDEREG